MTQTIIQLIPLFGLAFIMYLYFLQMKEIKELKKLNLKIDSFRNELNETKNLINELGTKFRKLDENVSNVKSKYLSEFDTLNNKISELFNRWIIVADERITSIPASNKEWFEAREIIEQKKQKVWKPKNLSQSKNSFINSKHSTYEEEINQDFSKLSDEDFENIIDEEDEDDTSSTTTNSAQIKKTTIQKKKPNQMKM